MSLDTALAALNTPTVPTQQQSISPKEVAAATVEQETNAKNNAKIVEPATKTENGADVKTEAPISKPVERDSAKFSALAKKEKAIVERSKTLNTKEATLAEREAAIIAREAKIKESDSLWDKDVFKALELRGYDYNKLTAMFLDGKVAPDPETDPVKLARKTIDDFKKEQAQKEEDQKTAAQKAEEAKKAQEKAELDAAWESYNSEVARHIEDNKETYELISTYNQQSLIAETVDEFYKANKRVLSIKEASDMVEAYLEAEAEKALNTKKISGKVTRATKPTEEVKKEEEPRITKTLNNSMQPTAASVLPAQSEADRMKRAMAALDQAAKR